MQHPFQIFSGPARSLLLLLLLGIISCPPKKNNHALTPEEEEPYRDAPGLRIYAQADGENNWQCLVERYPRESFRLAAKNAAWIECRSREDAVIQFETSLRQTWAGYFDMYLLHNLGEHRTRPFDDVDLWSFVQEKKAEPERSVASEWVSWFFTFRPKNRLIVEKMVDKCRGLAYDKNRPIVENGG